MAMLLLIGVLGFVWFMMADFIVVVVVDFVSVVVVAAVFDTKHIMYNVEIDYIER